MDGISGARFLTLGSHVPFKANKIAPSHPKRRHRVTNWLLMTSRCANAEA